MPPPPPQHGLAWTDELFDVVPTWTEEPDISVAKALAQQHLPHPVYEIAPFASGAFNKLYLLSPIDASSSSSDCYIMRVSLPVDPHFKTASEVATLEYIHRNTSIPVPRVIAYDTSGENELGFEWILMTRLEGVALKELWPKAELPWEDRVQITATVAGYIRQLRQLQSEKMGSLYLKDWSPPPMHWLEREADDIPLDRRDSAQFVPLASDPEFVIGPVVSIPFFYGNRIQLSSDRGPFDTSAAWLTSLLNLQVASTLHQKASMPMDDSDYDSDDLSELDGIVQASKGLLSIIPILFPSHSDTSNETFILYHDDLPTNNILVDPITHRVTGLVDWECVSLQPQWKASRAPQFLYGPEFDKSFYELNHGNLLPDVPPPPNEEEADPMRSELRERLEQMLLRRVLNDVLPPSEGRTERHKRIFENMVRNLDTNCGRVSQWVKKVESGGSPDPEQQNGIGMYVWLED